MSDDIIARLAAAHNASQEDESRLAMVDASASIARLRRLLHKYGDRIPLATNARPDWQQEIDEALEWVANNPENPDDQG